MAIAYVALGSNLGDKKKNLQRALMLLMQQGVEVLQVSGYFATEPYGVTDQPQFLNAVCKVRTNLEPVALLRTLLERSWRWGVCACVIGASAILIWICCFTKMS